MKFSIVIKQSNTTNWKKVCDECFIKLQCYSIGGNNCLAADLAELKETDENIMSYYIASFKEEKEEGESK